VIDSGGLVLTIGYLMVEAHSAELITQDGHSVAANVVGYDHETGFGLLRAAAPLHVRPMPMGKSADLKANDQVLIASFGGTDMVGAARVVARREFVGSWEYLLEDAIFTAPPHPLWSGAALINREGRLAARLPGGRRCVRQGRHPGQHVRPYRPPAADPGRTDL
jgi:S1-C subfamily serine protease